MNAKQLGLIVTAISCTIAAHGAVVQYGVRRQEAMLREMRATLEPLRADVARAHNRLDGHLAWHGSTPQP
jgi:hypothetical protein